MGKYEVKGLPSSAFHFLLHTSYLLLPLLLFRHVPNALTGLRLLLAIVFFALLSIYQYEGRGAWLLNSAFVLYSVALFTDFLDGYLARKWKVEGAFGRITDPFVDKILVLGSFAFFSGKNFVVSEAIRTAPPLPDAHFVAKTITGVAPVVIVILIARELLVTVLRSHAEASGHAFGADRFGKVKMVVQSVTILAILAYVNYLDLWKQLNVERPVTFFRDLCIWTTVIVTVLSCVGYVRRSIALYRKPSP